MSADSKPDETTGTAKSTGTSKPGGDAVPDREKPRPREHGGPTGPEPTRYGDWEKNGRCSDF